MDPEFRDLVPLFAEEARDRLERMALALPRLGTDAQAAVEVKRELHTLKGAGRMMRIGVLAELAHAAEEVLLGGEPKAVVPLLTRVVDELTAMVEAIAAGKEPAADGELLASLREATTGEKAAAVHPTDRTDPTERIDPTDPPEEPAPAPLETAAPATGAARAPGPPVADVRVDAAALDAVAERATQVRIMAVAGRQVVDRLYDLARLAEEGLHEPQPKQVLAVLSTMLRRAAVELEGGQGRLIRSAEEQLDKMLSLQLQPLRGFFHSYARYARDLARQLKREVEIETAGEETRLDRRIARELDEAILHLIRNAVDHGIEPPQVRQKQGKPRAGRIVVSAVAEGARVRLSIADDGYGIDVAKVVKEAVRSGLITAGAAQSLPREEALRLVFSLGFSTRGQVSEISGRGVGLDVVASVVNRVGGEVFLDTEPRKGSRFTLEVPVARRGEHVLLLRVGDLRLALPAAAVRRASQIDPAQVIERDGRSFVRLDGRVVGFVPLARLYGQHGAERPLLLEGVVSGQPLAVAVDFVEGEQEVLVRPVSRRVVRDRVLEGTALLASGEPVAVLSPAALARREVLQVQPVPREPVRARRIRLLLVDDSLVTREMERRLLEDAGFEVTPAGDAHDALSLLAEASFDCVVTDIEMPGMDGFELASQLRSLEPFAHLPIIVVSTRDRPEDRLRGLQVGADAYLTKQGLDAGELVEIVRRLTRR